MPATYIRVPVPSIVLAVCLSFSVSAADELTLREAIDLALRHNRDLAKARLAVRSDEVGVDYARREFSSEFRPQGSIGADTGDGSLGLGLQWSKKLAWGTRLTAGAGVSGGQAKGDDGDEWAYQGHGSLGLAQPLFENAGRLVNREPVVKAVESLRAQRRVLHMQEADVIVGVVESYVDVQRLSAQIRADTLFLARMTKLYRLTAAREKQGKASRVDSLRVGLQKGRAEIRLASDRERLSSRRRDLLEQIGIETNEALSLASVPFVESEMPDHDTAVALAFSNRLDYAQVLEDEASAKRGILIANKRLSPNVSLITRYSFTESIDAGSENNADNRWFVGLASDGDLLKSRERLTAQGSLLTHEARKWDIEIVENAIKRQVLQELATCRRSLAEVSIGARNLELAASRADLARRLFEAGRGDNFAATDAADAAFLAGAELLTARATAVVSTYRLRRTLGTLIDSPIELKPKAVGGLQ